MSVIECVPNFSEGRDSDILARLQKAAQSVPGAALLDVHTDADHNRSVFTVAGSPEAVAEAAFALVETAVAHIDLTRHGGTHPRMGAADVLPFVPLKGATMADCVAVSKQVAARIGAVLQVPVFLYEASATRPERVNLADIRRGGFEGMPEKLLQPAWTPDYGPKKMHPTAGVMAVGARKPLVAFNVNLDTANLTVAKRIAKSVRGSSGGLKYCKALGMMMASRNQAQVSMNMVDCDETPIYEAYELIRAEAARYGVSVASSELVGLAPSKALLDCAAYYLKLTDFNADSQVLENRI